MSEPIARYLAEVQRRAARPAINPEGKAITAKLFMLMHGMYGALFLSKFATGELNEAGKDKGILSARMVWQSDLERFDASTIEEAVRRCKETHKQFPPSLPEFVALCRASMPRIPYAATVARDPNAIGMSDELRSATSRRIREEAIARVRQRLDAEAGTVPEQGALVTLRQLCAKAIALAGGDEARALRRLEVQ